MSTTIIRKTLKVDGVLTDASTATIHVVRTDTGLDVVAAGTAMVHAGTGDYTCTITDPAAGLTYTFTCICTMASGAVITIGGTVAGTPADTGVISLVEAKLHLRVDGATDDALIQTLIAAAVQWAENYTGRRFLTTTEVYTLDEFPGDTLLLPWSPLRSVTTITYVDTAGTVQTLAPAVYHYETLVEPGAIELAYAQSWPTSRTQLSAIVITYSVGYGLAEDVPDAIKAAIKVIVAQFYANREAGEIPQAAKMLLYPYKVWM